MKKFFFNLYFWPAFLATTIIGLCLLPIIVLVNLIVLGRSCSKALRLAIRVYGYILVCIIPFRAPVKVIGHVDSIPTPCIIVANHNSAIDPYLFGAIPIENCFITSWPFKIPIYGPLMKLAGYINIEDGWENMRSECIERLSSGSSITIWPEGHRSRNGSMGRFRKGAFQLAVETGYPIQPVCIVGSGHIMFPGERTLTPGKVMLVLLDPLYPDTDNPDHAASIQKLRKEVIISIENCLTENNNYHRTTINRSFEKGSPISTKAMER